MLEHETNEHETHYGANLSHWYGDTNPLTIDAGGLRALIEYYSAEKPLLSKSEARALLESGQHVEDLFRIVQGQSCDIVKAEQFPARDGCKIVYAPDLTLNLGGSFKTDDALDEGDVNEFLSVCYTVDDFINECKGNVQAAEALFHFCDWQHPSSAVNEGFLEDFEGNENS